MAVAEPEAIPMLLLTLLLLAEIPRDIARDNVDVIEVSHFYDDQARLVFRQDIFYDWSADDARYQVRAWRLIRETDSPTRQALVPQRDWVHGGYTAIWQDGDLLRVVRAASFRETFLQYDVELAEREWLPKENRKELRPPHCNPRTAATIIH